MNCQYYDNNFETCTNGDCPFCSDFCPVTENQEICRYSGLDETENMLRGCLDNEEKDHREAIQSLAEENQELKKQLDEVTAERDAAIKELDEVSSCVDELDKIIDSELHPVVDYSLYMSIRENADAISIWRYEKEWRVKGK